jgi:hypothetical protein
LRLEGNSVEEILAKVQAQFGSAAHVVEAEKVRSGGIGGFFAREYVAVTVDVPEELAVLDSEPQRSLTPRAASVGGGTSTLAQGMSTSEVRAGATTTGAQGLEAMLAAADASDGFISEVNEAAPRHEASDSRHVTLDARFTAPDPHSIGADTRAGTPEPRPSQWQAHHHGGDSRFADTLKAESANAQRDFEILMPHEAPHVDRNVTPVVWPTAARVETSHREQDFDEILRSAKALVQESPTSDAPELTPPAAPGTFDIRTGGATLAELLDVGIPSDLLGHLPLSRGQHTLSTVLNHVPKPPELWPDAGSIVVVLGTGTSALPTARIVANKMGVLEREIIGAGPLSAQRVEERGILTAQAARALRRGAREGLESVVVFLDIGPAQTDAYHAGRLLDALDPDHIVVAIRADHDIAHTARTLSEVTQGRPLHSLAAEGVIGSIAPARVLSLSVPVAYIDTLEANPVVWAAAISQALPNISWD